MVLKFIRTEQDFRAFADHFWSTSKTIRKALRRNYIFGAIAALFTVTMAVNEMRARNHHTTVLTYLLLGVCAAGSLILLFSFPLLRIRYRRMTLKVYRESRVDPYGPVTVELTDEGIRAGNKNLETSVRWSGVERIDTSGDYTFVHIGTVGGLILPRSSVTEGDYEVFVAALKERWERYKAEGAASMQ